MLKLSFSPQRNEDGQLTARWDNPFLTINKVQYNLSELPDGATAEHEILKKVERIGDDYEVLLILPHGPNAPEETRFPQDIFIDANGQITIPPYSVGGE